LTFAEEWTQYGLLTRNECAAAMQPMFDQFCFNQGVCRVIGEIICFAASTPPDDRWLECDGDSLAIADYPDLYAVIGNTYGAVDSDHFNIPDLRGRVVINQGTGSGLSPRAVGDSFGEETHTLEIIETPVHSHTDTGHDHLYANPVPTVINGGLEAPAAAAFPSADVTAPGTAHLTDTGGGGAHNNMQPSLVLAYFIVAKD